MPTRRTFLQQSAALSGLFGFNTKVIQDALAIEPEPGSTFEDAEHVVILMQENRSFDHAFGSLRGVRGFNDPQAVHLADGHTTFVQKAASGERHVPFRLDIKNTKSTWMGCLPHGWTDQVDAANGGKHDRWLDVKKVNAYPKQPLTMGFHTREDIPFYYTLADAFTVCDQNFCSTLTGTTPNRLHLWTGTIRTKPTTEVPAFVRNEDSEYGSWQNWTTFPDRLEDAGVSWAIYQNELTVPTGFTGEAESWLANFGDSPLEWFTQFGSRFSAKHREHLQQQVKSLPGQIATLEKQAKSQSAEAAAKTCNRIASMKKTLARCEQDLIAFSPENFEKLPERLKSMHRRACTTNVNDPSYRDLAEISYHDGDKQRTLKVPKGDVLHQFRKDVKDGTLPMVSWIVPSERFSDHPCSAWYGQWYLSEVLKILTQNPAVWKKTVFILTYDENDGYFDHVPPFQAPHPEKPETGRTSKGIDTALEWLEEAADRKHKPNGAVRGNSLGLGFRVPMIIASPWTRGGHVCSQVFDHTSVLQFLEKFVTKKSGRKVEETNITDWRRTVCGDLTSAFQSAADAAPGLEGFVERNPFLESIHSAQYKPLPGTVAALTPKELQTIRDTPKTSRMPRQEPGTRPSCPLPYELTVDGALSEKHDSFVLQFDVGNKRHLNRSVGAPFIVYAITAQGMSVRHYAVAAGEKLEDRWPLAEFAKGRYHIRVHGPNGFVRVFEGDSDDVPVAIDLRPSLTHHRRARLKGGASVWAHNHDAKTQTLIIRDHSYGSAEVRMTAKFGLPVQHDIETPASQGWYDVSVRLAESPRFLKRYAGRIETGRWSISDPAMA